ncbi:MAG TPA: hypothetical protein VNV41_16375 [Candidatus Acidoferrales bacterium]|jgi:hypothetical protein|nr:hypothetical protein [Candidatus Acidoferrales bacterium]
MTPERIPHDVEALKSKLAVFTRLGSSLRNASVRNRDQIAAVEHEIDLIRAALGYPTNEVSGALACSVDALPTASEMRDADRWARTLSGGEAA